MSGVKWTPLELKKLKEIHSKKPSWTTDYELAGLIAPQFSKSPESVRWQLRQLRRNGVKVQSPKILMLDIETLPIEALVWDVWKQNIYMEQIEKDWSVLCYSAKWLFSPKVLGQVVTPAEAKEHSDRSLMIGLWELMNEADIIVTHNGNQFDLKKLNWRFFVNGFPKPMYYQSIDTKKIATDTFAATYNKLDWIAQVLGIGRKIETDFKWWKECHDGNEKFLKMMLKYNKWDVNLEEEVYLKMRPWMDKHPNMNVFAVDSDVPHCPACGSDDIHWNGKYTTPLGLYEAFRCQKCGAIGRSTRKQYKLAGAIASN